MKFRSSSVLSWILEEIQENTVILDTVTIVCKDGERLTTSSVLMTAISPYLASTFDYLINEDLVLLMPDVDAEVLSKFFDWILAKRLHTDTISDKEILTNLNGIFWTIDKTKMIFPLKSVESVPLLENLFTFIKCENDDDDSNIAEDFKMAPETADLIKQSAVNEDKSGVETKENVIIKSRTKTKKKGSKQKKGLPGIKEDVSDKENLGGDAIISAEGENINKEESDQIFTEESTDGISKKRKVKQGLVASNKLIKISDDGDENEGGESFDANDVSHGDSDSGQDEVSMVKSSKTTPGRKGKRTKGRRKFIAKDYLPKDESYQIAQSKLLNALEDKSILTDPFYLWHEYYGFPLDAKFSKVELKLICPKCSLSCPISSKGQVFFNHIRSHKIRNYDCSCKPSVGGFPAVKAHIESVHWNWSKCQLCSDLVDPKKMTGHMLRKHNQYSKDTVCPDCGATFGSENSKDFRMHMEYHKADKFFCDCKIMFENRKEKVHHMQVVHLKELFCCDQCHTVCLTDDNLKLHKLSKHVNKVKKQCPICDICGYVCKSDKPWLLRWHKERMHDPVLIDCTQCSTKLNASAMKDHMKSHANAGICTECGAQVQNVKRHMKARHRPQEFMKYKCEFCTKAFQYSRDIKRHMMSAHLKERPYKCRFGCEFAYNDSSNRNQHEKKKHGGIYSVKTLEVVKDEG